MQHILTTSSERVTIGLSVGTSSKPVQRTAAERHSWVDMMGWRRSSSTEQLVLEISRHTNVLNEVNDTDTLSQPLN